MEEINKSEDILNVLFDYVNDYFDNFGHHGGSNWWTNSDFGGSWSPFIETCFMLKGKEYDYKIRRCSTHSNITKYVEQFHRFHFREKNSHFFKHPCRGLDVSWLEQDNTIFLAIEHSEDSPSETTENGMKEIERIKKELKYSNNEDKNVIGPTAINQLLAIRDEITKLKDFKSHFKVLISRPRRFDAIDGKRKPTYNQSVEYFKNRIEEDLKKDAKYFNDDEIWVIILIVPNPDEPYSRTVSPNKIIFHCYEWKGKNEENGLSEIDANHMKYTIPIKKVKFKWAKDNSMD